MIVEKLFKEEENWSIIDYHYMTDFAFRRYYIYNLIAEHTGYNGICSYCMCVIIINREDS